MITAADNDETVVNSSTDNDDDARTFMYLTLLIIDFLSPPLSHPLHIIHVLMSLCVSGLPMPSMVESCDLVHTYPRVGSGSLLSV